MTRDRCAIVLKFWNDKWRASSRFPSASPRWSCSYRNSGRGSPGIFCDARGAGAASSRDARRAGTASFRDARRAGTASFRDARRAGAASSPRCAKGMNSFVSMREGQEQLRLEIREGQEQLRSECAKGMSNFASRCVAERGNEDPHARAARGGHLAHRIAERGAEGKSVGRAPKSRAANRHFEWRTGKGGFEQRAGPEDGSRSGRRARSYRHRSYCPRSEAGASRCGQYPRCSYAHRRRSRFPHTHPGTMALPTPASGRLFFIGFLLGSTPA